VTDPLRTSVSDAVVTAIAASPNAVARQDLIGAIRSLLTAAAPDLQLVADGPVVIDAEYEETGRLLNDTERVSLDEHERAVLRSVQVDLQGALDG
jgi:hypothetical protein